MSKLSSSREQGAKLRAGTIDVTPTWSSLLGDMLERYEQSSSAEVRTTIKSELYRMAKFADDMNSKLQAGKDLRQYWVQLFPQHSPSHRLLAKELSGIVADYNQEQPDIELDNYIHNRSPYMYVAYELPNDSGWDIQFRDQQLRVGTCKLVII